MNASFDTTVRQKLFHLATRPAPIHSHPLVVIPDSLDDPIEAKLLFETDAAYRVLELGCGWGEYAIEWMRKNPLHEYTVMEIKADRIKKLLQRFENLKIGHLRVIPINFNWFFECILPHQCFDRIIVNFPDPWPKKKHHKHRLIHAPFPQKAGRLLRKGGIIQIATDYGPYARKILQIFRQSPDYESCYPFPHYRREHPESQPYTKFERIHLDSAKHPYYQAWRFCSTAGFNAPNRTSSNAS